MLGFFWYFSLKKSAYKSAFVTQNKAILIFLNDLTPFFRQKLPKIAENWDHNINPRIQSFEFGIYNYNASVEVG
jgi:hypothetical protein